MDVAPGLLRARYIKIIRYQLIVLKIRRAVAWLAEEETDFDDRRLGGRLVRRPSYFFSNHAEHDGRTDMSNLRELLQGSGENDLT